MERYRDGPPAGGGGGAIPHRGYRTAEGVFGIPYLILTSEKNKTGEYQIWN